MHTVRTFAASRTELRVGQQVDDGQLVKLSPDHTIRSPRAARYKGRRGSARRPDRPTSRWCAADGQWRNAGTRAWRPVAGVAIIDLHGLFGAYVGTPPRDLFTRRHAAACSGCASTSSGAGPRQQFVASEAVLGSSAVHPIPDTPTPTKVTIGENPCLAGAVLPSPTMGELRRQPAVLLMQFINPPHRDPEMGGHTLSSARHVWFLAPRARHRPARRVRLVRPRAARRTRR
jgi:hypothetical protein